MDGHDAEDWIIDRGHEVVQKKADRGLGSLSTIEQLVLCLWYADYCMRNAGDLANLDDLCPDCLLLAAQSAEKLDLPASQRFFARTHGEFEMRFFAEFTGVVTEIEQADKELN